MKKYVLLIILMSFKNLAFAEIKVNIEPSQVSVGETFVLTLTQENFQGGGFPDLSPLKPNFTILGTQRSMNYTVINGQARSTSQWVISLKPLNSGILTIPSIQMGNEQTDPLTINVEVSAKPHQKTELSQASEEAVLLKTKVNEKKPYINQQVLYTVKLYNNKRLLDVDYQGPQAENAVIVPLGDAKHYQEEQNNATYVVEEQTYALFPQKSGSFKIASPIFSALIYDIDSRQVKLSNKPIELNVQPIPSLQKANEWLPAQQVTLSEYYENSDQSLSQGSTLTRVVTLEGVAVPSQLLPTLDFNQGDAFNVYLEKGAEKNQVKNGNLVGNKMIKVTYLFNKAGKITIPELRLPWFNTQTGKEEVAVLAPRSMDIGPALVSASENPLPKEKVAGLAENKKVPNEIQTQVVTSKGAWAAALLFAVAWIVTLILWLKPKAPRLFSKRQSTNVLKELRKACTEGNPNAARDALLRWGAMQWPDAPLLNLTDLTLLVRDAALKKQITLLSQILYAGEGNALWRGDELFRAVSAFKRHEPVKQPPSKALPPMNPY